MQRTQTPKMKKVVENIFALVVSYDLVNLIEQAQSLVQEVDNLPNIEEFVQKRKAVVENDSQVQKFGFDGAIYREKITPLRAQFDALFETLNDLICRKITDEVLDAVMRWDKSPLDIERIFEFIRYHLVLDESPNALFDALNTLGVAHVHNALVKRTNWTLAVEKYLDHVHRFKKVNWTFSHSKRTCAVLPLIHLPPEFNDTYFEAQASRILGYFPNQYFIELSDHKDEMRPSFPVGGLTIASIKTASFKKVLSSKGFAKVYSGTERVPSAAPILKFGAKYLATNPFAACLMIIPVCQDYLNWILTAKTQWKRDKTCLTIFIHELIQFLEALEDFKTTECVKPRELYLHYRMQLADSSVLLTQILVDEAVLILQPSIYNQTVFTSEPSDYILQLMDIVVLPLINTLDIESKLIIPSTINKILIALEQKLLCSKKKIVRSGAIQLGKDIEYLKQTLHQHETIYMIDRFAIISQFLLTQKQESHPKLPDAAVWNKLRVKK